jgi:hypothetical protein
MFSQASFESRHPSRKSTRRGGPLQFRSLWPSVEAALVDAWVQGERLNTHDGPALVEPPPAKRSGTA